MHETEIPTHSSTLKAHFLVTQIQISTENIYTFWNPIFSLLHFAFTMKFNVRT